MSLSEEMKAWAFKNKKYISLSDGQSINLLVKNAKPVESKFDPEKEVMRFYCELEDGSVKCFENGSSRLVEILADYLGKWVNLRREGEGNDTKYIVTPRGNPETSNDAEPGNPSIS